MRLHPRLPATCRLLLLSWRHHARSGYRLSITHDSRCNRRNKLSERGRKLLQGDIAVTPLPGQLAANATPVTPLPGQPAPSPVPCVDVQPTFPFGFPFVSPLQFIEAEQPENPAVQEVASLLGAIGRKLQNKNNGRKLQASNDGRTLKQTTPTCAALAAEGQCGAAYLVPQAGASSFCALSCGRCTP